MRKGIYLSSTIIPLWLSGVAICHDRMLWAFVALVCAAILLYKGGVCEPEQYDNSTLAES